MRIRPKAPEIKECPVCGGMGNLLNPESQKADPPCYLCGGEGYVVMRVCRGCGKPAFASIAGGPPSCFEAACLKNVLKKAVYNYVPFGKHVPHRPFGLEDWDGS